MKIKVDKEFSISTQEEWLKKNKEDLLFFLIEENVPEST